MMYTTRATSVPQIPRTVFVVHKASSADPLLRLKNRPTAQLLVWELGVHASLSAEPLHMWARSLPGFDILHRNLVQDQYPEWLPDKCKTLYSHSRLTCDTLRDEVTQVFQRHIPKSATSNEPITTLDEFAS